MLLPKLTLFIEQHNLRLDPQLASKPGYYRTTYHTTSQRLWSCIAQPSHISMCDVQYKDMIDRDVLVNDLKTNEH